MSQIKVVEKIQTHFMLLIKGEFSQKHNLFRTDGVFCN